MCLRNGNTHWNLDFQTSLGLGPLQRLMAVRTVTVCLGMELRASPGADGHFSWPWFFLQGDPAKPPGESAARPRQDLALGCVSHAHFQDDTYLLWERLEDSSMCFPGSPNLPGRAWDGVCGEYCEGEWSWQPAVDIVASGGGVPCLLLWVWLSLMCGSFGHHPPRPL